MRILRAGRVRWRMKSETFNPLEMHGDESGHNLDHGSCNLSDVLSQLMMLALLIDLAEQRCRALFDSARKKAERLKYFRDGVRNEFQTCWLRASRTGKPNTCPLPIQALRLSSNSTTRPEPGCNSGPIPSVLQPQPHLQVSMDRSTRNDRARHCARNFASKTGSQCESRFTSKAVRIARHLPPRPHD